MGLHLQLHQEAESRQERRAPRQKGRHHGGGIHGFLRPVAHPDLPQVSR